MMEDQSSSKKTAIDPDRGFTDIIFSWSLEDIFNEDLYKEQVENIGLLFPSVDAYFASYLYPLLEETRAQLCSSMEILSSAPFAEVIAIEEAKQYGKKLYDVKIDGWNNRFTDRGKEPYKTLPGDVLVLADFKPETVNDLQRVGKTWTFVSVARIPEDETEESVSIYFKVQASKDIDLNEAKQKSVFVVFLTNIIPNRRIWSALHMSRKSELIKKLICAGDEVEESCDYCYPQTDAVWDDKVCQRFSSQLNESQNKAVCACLYSLHCNHRSTVDLIWGPPGTGKTKTLGALLFALLKMKCRILACAPTNVAIKEVASRVLSMVRDSFDRKSDALFCSLGDMLLFGNHERLKVGVEIEEIYLDYRVKQLTKCFAPSTGWRYCFASMIDLLENCVSHYQIFIENELIKEKEYIEENENGESKDQNNSNCGKGKCKSFLDFVRDRFVAIASPLRNCISILCTHVARSYILEHNFQNLVCLIEILDSFQALLFQSDILCEGLEEILSRPEMLEGSSQPLVGAAFLLYKKRTECLSALRAIRNSLIGLKLPVSLSKESIREFCFQTSSLIFSTASSSYRLHSMPLKPLNILVIDEAAQLKECESVIPLLLPGINHAILVGDECQIPAMVESKVSYKVGFGRSLFERLSLLGYSKFLLNIQYRMHPSISCFPNSYFYNDQIRDAQNVQRKNYAKHYLPWPMFGPYSFINIVGGKEEDGDAGRSRKNMVEVAVVMKLLKNLHKVWLGSKEKLCVGIVSPYAAQVVAIQEKVGQKFDTFDGFDVNVKSIDGFQGGEQDIIILSTVRTDSSESLEFISSPQRINVALTRARHCLWILGNERTLSSHENVWKDLVLNAKNRHCFFNADEDEDLVKAILDTKKELDQIDDLLNADSVLFRNSRWKVLFSDNFLKSFKKLQSERTKKSVLSLLLRLSGGRRPKRRKVDMFCGNSSKILKKFKVEYLYVVCSTDIVKESRYTQVLKIWDILPLECIPKLVKRLESIFGNYTDDFISHCEEKCFEGNMEVPMSWAKTTDIIRFKNLNNSGNEGELNISATDGRSYVENSKVGESLLLMKFYSLSSSVVSHLLSDRNGLELDLPFEVTEEELEIILFPQSTFVLGRSGTGKTTVLTMKLFQKEKLNHIAVEATYGTKSAAVDSLSQNKECEESKENTAKTERPVLRQLFVTVSPKLCQAVKHHITRLKRFISGGSISAESSSVNEDIDDTSVQFKDIPDSFVDVPSHSYPLVITFNKFLIILDGTLGNSFFERFYDPKYPSNNLNLSVRSVSLETVVRWKEVNYDRFASLYWPHFNSQITKKLDSSRVFVEIISHIKGGIQATKPGDGKLSREDYVILSENRTSSLSRQRREMIYDIYESYEKMKIDNGEFDLADFVIDLHRRLRIEKYEGAQMDFVYIDEVQDLTMSQLALFKYICQNVEEGFVFSGDTAQTIARGIDFRFQDIRSLFYKKFVLESKRCTNSKRKEKVKISDIFLLSQNFRTHAGVLKLSQSIIDLLFRFFPYSVDVLKPETSLIYGEAPIVLESGNRQNAIITIFGNSGHVGGKIVGFGAEQVILVRDDAARKEILDYIGKQALVLTILECKGLEFQDVLLYNFFGSSPLKNRWRVIYEYMKEQDMLDSKEHLSFPSFNDSKHNVLCSELKQLYVAVTRTRQRLWICEKAEDFSTPMFDYWKKKCLVQVKQLDDSLAQAMKVASSPEEWKSRGIKLYYQNNFEMATMCFERAGDSYWEKKSKASGLKLTAKHLRDHNSEDASAVLREAAEIFEGIGMVDSAAVCFSDLGDYERAGKLYLEKCEEPDLKRAGECFYLAGHYKSAAEVFARGSFFFDCLTVCSKGRLFDIGLDYIQHWKQNEAAGLSVVNRHELDKIEQNFLESCADNNFQHNDMRSMMKFVKAFYSMDLKRKFLRSLGLLNELLLLEEEAGNFMEAANIASLIGDILLEADLLGRAGKFMEASEHLIFYVLANSLWSAGSKGWPLKPFPQKGELLKRAMSMAKEESISFYELICTEADILSNDHSSLFKIMTDLNSSRRYSSTKGEILCLRKLLDAHFQLNSSKYVWQDEFIVNPVEKVEQMILKNRFSVETLFYSWNCWKNNIVNILEYLSCLKTQEVNQYGSYTKFALNYLGVWKQISNLNEIYLLLIPDADWVMKEDGRFLKKNGRLVYVDVHLLVSAGQKYWCSELLSTGVDVLRNLEALHKFSVNKVDSVFCQSRSLLLIYEVSKFLLECRFFIHNHNNLKTLNSFFRVPIDHFFGYVVPLNWRKSLTKNMVSLRRNEACYELVKEIIYENIRRKDKLTYGQMGRVAVSILATGKLENELCGEIMRRFDGNSPWKEFFQSFLGTAGGNEASNEVHLIHKFYEALRDTYSANWVREVDYISPNCFCYLIERLLMLTSCCNGLIFATKSSFVEWLIYQDGNSLPNLTFMAHAQQNLEVVHNFIECVLHQLLSNPNDTIKWIRISIINDKEYFPLLVLRLVVLICLLHLSSGKCFKLLNDLLGKSHITELLPWEFNNVLRKRRKHLGLEVFAEAFKNIDNPLVIVRLQNNPEILCPDAVFIDLMVSQSKDDVFQVLFPERVETPHVETAADVVEASDSTCKVFSATNCSSLQNTSSALVADQALSTKIKCDINMPMTRIDCFWGMLNTLVLPMDEKQHHEVLYISQTIKGCVYDCINILLSSISGSSQQDPVNIYQDEMGEVVSMIDEMKQLSAALSVSNLENNISVIGELSKTILLRRPKVEHSLNQIFLHYNNISRDVEAFQANSTAGNEHGENNLEASKDNMSEASEAVVNSKNNSDNKKGKRSKSKKNKGGKKGRK